MRTSDKPHGAFSASAARAVLGTDSCVTYPACQLRRAPGPSLVTALGGTLGEASGGMDQSCLLRGAHLSLPVPH